MKRLFLMAAIVAGVLGGLYFGVVYAYQNRLYAPVSRLIGDDTKALLRDTVFVFQRKTELEREIADLERRLDRTSEVQDLLEVALLNNPNLPEYLPFDRVSEETLATARDRFEVVRYETPFVPLSHWGRRAYVEIAGDDLWLITAKGTVGRVPLEQIAGDGFRMTAVHTNLHDLIPNPDFYEISEFSIKDALVQDGRLLLSYSKDVGDGCYTLAIAAANLADDPLAFQDIFVPDECITEDNDYGEFSANQTGGRMLAMGPGKILFSTGEWRVRDLAQDPQSLFGKVVEIDLATGTWVVKSMGHRNPQGLYHDAAANLIVVAEHGPDGGDEININRTPDGAPENYGWPISSYGEHYSTEQKYYDKAPLHKSHADYGFIEPDRYFVPAISPSEVLRMPSDPRDPDRYALLMGTMGFDYREGDESLHIIDLDRDFRIATMDRIVLDDRVRDMVSVPGTNRYVVYLEGDVYELGTLALVTVNP